MNSKTKSNIFFYSVRGSNDDSPNVGKVTADTQDDAERKIQETYNFNPESEINGVAYEFIDQSKFQEVEQIKGHELTHHID